MPPHADLMTDSIRLYPGKKEARPSMSHRRAGGFLNSSWLYEKIDLATKVLEYDVPEGEQDDDPEGDADGLDRRAAVLAPEDHPDRNHPDHVDQQGGDR